MFACRGEELSSPDDESLSDLRSDATVVEDASLRFRDCVLDVTVGKLDWVDVDRLCARIPGVAGAGGDIGLILLRVFALLFAEGSNLGFRCGGSSLDGR